MLEPLKLKIFIFDYRGYGKSEGKPNQLGTHQDALTFLDHGVKMAKKLRSEKTIVYCRYAKIF